MIENWLLILLLVVMAVGFGSVSVLLGRLLGPKNPTPEKQAPYECGMPAVGDARERQSIRFYLIAMIFLLFDIEVAFRSEERRVGKETRNMQRTNQKLRHTYIIMRSKRHV